MRVRSSGHTEDLPRSLRQYNINGHTLCNQKLLSAVLSLSSTIAQISHSTIIAVSHPSSLGVPGTWTVLKTLILIGGIGLEPAQRFRTISLSLNNSRQIQVQIFINLSRHCALISPTLC